MFSNLKPEKTIKAFGQGNSQIDLVCDQTTDNRYILKRIRNIDTPLQEAMFYKETNALKNCITAKTLSRLFMPLREYVAVFPKAGCILNILAETPSSMKHIAFILFVKNSLLPSKL